MLEEQGEVYIRGKRRDGLISDNEMSGLRIGLVSFVSFIRTVKMSARPSHSDLLTNAGFPKRSPL